MSDIKGKRELLDFTEGAREIEEVSVYNGLEVLAVIYSAKYGLKSDSLRFLTCQNFVMALYASQETGKKSSPIDAVIPILYKDSVSLDEIKEMGFSKKQLIKLKKKVSKELAYAAFAESKVRYDAALKKYQDLLAIMPEQLVKVPDRFSKLLEDRVKASNETLYNIMMIVITLKSGGALYQLSHKTLGLYSKFPKSKDYVSSVDASV